MRLVALLLVVLASLSSGSGLTAGGQRDADEDAALAHVRRLAENGDRLAQFTLAEVLYFGSPSTAEAVTWYRKAAAQEFPAAEFRLGQLFEFGFGVDPDMRQALTWYLTAARHGDAAGARAAGDILLKGRGVEADPLQAVSWLRRGAEGDDLRAQVQLGQLYLDGVSVPRDYIAAYVWFHTAASQTPLVDNYKALVELRNIAAARMRPEELAEAEKRAAARLGR